MADKKETPMLDPIAYRSDYRPEDISPELRGDPNIPGVGPLNANENYQEYGDDSNPAWQGQKGGLNPKYEGEGVMNTELEYDPNITTGGLDPNYKFGENARQQNAQESGYIARRNDMIASALYNEGKVSREDVANYLAAQKGRFDSTEADRQNTIESVWKRLGQYTGNGDQNGNTNVNEANADAIVQGNGGKIYGKDTAEEGNPKNGIDTKSDANSVFTAMEEARASNLKTLISMPPADIATALDKGLLPGDLQSIRDMQQYYPELWDEVKQYQKKIKTQNEVNSISKGEQSDTDNAGQSVINNSIADFANNNGGAIKTSQEISADVRDSLASNQTAQEANELMATLEEDMATLKNRLKNLRTEANKAFKGDVPDYLVNAYVANKTQEIQNQMSILEDRYNMAYNRYKDEVANTQWEKEYQLKVQQLGLQKESADLDKWYKEQGIALEWFKAMGGAGTSTTNPGDTYAVTTMSDEEVAAAVDELLNEYDNGNLGNAQCAAGIQKYYLPKLGIELSNLSSWENKKKLINTDSSYVPKKGDLIIINSGAKLSDGTPAGHIGIVIGVSNDGYVQYLDWNGSLDANGKGTEKVAINSVEMDNKKIEGYRNVNKQGGTGTSLGYDREFTESDYETFEAFLDTDKKTRLSESEKNAIAEQYGFKDNLKGMTDFANAALQNRPEVPQQEDLSPEELTWVDYTGMSEEQIADIEKKIGYNPNIEWELKKIIDKGIPTSGPAMQNVLKTVRAKDEEQLGQWIDHYQNKVNAEAVKAGEDILLLLAQLQIAYDDADRVKEVTKDGKTKTVFDTNATQGWGWGAIGIKYNQLIKQLLLNKVTEAREKGATFGQMTEYEWRILEDAASALRIKFGYGSNDESFSTAFFDLVEATWKLTNGTSQKPTRTEWNNYVNQVKKESEWYMADTGVDGSNLGGGETGDTGGTGTGGNNSDTMNELFPS